MSNETLPNPFNPPSFVREKRMSKLWTDLDLRIMALTLAVQYAVGTDNSDDRVEVGELTKDYYDFLRTRIYPDEPSDDEPDPNGGIHSSVVELSKHKSRKIA